MADPKYGLRRYVLCDVVFEVVAFAPAIVFLMRSLDRTPKRSQLAAICKRPAKRKTSDMLKLVYPKKVDPFTLILAFVFLLNWASIFVHLSLNRPDQGLGPYMYPSRNEEIMIAEF